MKKVKRIVAGILLVIMLGIILIQTEEQSTDITKEKTNPKTNREGVER